MTAPTLVIRDLQLGLPGLRRHQQRCCTAFRFHVGRGERVALVGESGSGKSVTARIILGLLQEQRSARVSGEVEFEGRDLEKLCPRRSGTRCAAPRCR